MDKDDKLTLEILVHFVDRDGNSQYSPKSFHVLKIINNILFFDSSVLPFIIFSNYFPQTLYIDCPEMDTSTNLPYQKLS